MFNELRVLSIKIIIYKKGGGIPPLEGLLRTRRRAKTHRERGHQQPFRLGQGEDGPRTDERGVGEIAERERHRNDSLGA